MIPSAFAQLSDNGTHKLGSSEIFGSDREENLTF
jgi:hypothetical protein